MLLRPSLGDLAGTGSILLVSALLTLLGGAATAGRAAIEVRLLAGWGVAATILTLWGTLTDQPLVYAAAALGAAALAACLVPRLRPDRAMLAEAGQMLLLALPILLILASVRPALPDTFLNLLPNAAYLVDHGRLPDGDAVRTLSIFPALPYNQQFVVYLASLIEGGLSASGLVTFNLVVQLAAALFFGRLLATQLNGPTKGSPGWRDCALGLALVIALNPGFMPKIAFSGMGEPGTEATLAVAAGLLLASLPAMRGGRPDGAALWQAGLVLLAFINIRQSNVGLFAALAVTLVLMVVLDPALRTRQVALRLAAALVPAALLYGVWRGYVSARFEVGELKILPMAQWQVGALPAIFGAIARTILGRPFLYLCHLLALAALFLSWRRRGWSPATRALLAVLALTLAYVGFLLFTYVARFASEEDPAHSFFRYTTHLSLVLVLALAWFVIEWLRGQPRPAAGRLYRGTGAVAIAVALLLPLAILPKLRFDLVMPQPLVWDMTKQFARDLQPGDRLALVAPGDNGTLALQMRGYLELTAPRRPDLDVAITDRTDLATLTALANQGYRKAIVTCATGTNLDPGRPAAVLARFDQGAWIVTDTYLLPTERRGKWDPVIAAPPLCGVPAVAADRSTGGARAHGG